MQCNGIRDWLICGLNPDSATLHPGYARCPAHDMACGNGSERRQHPIELSGEDWYKEWGIEVTGPDAKNFDPSEHGYSKNKNTR